MRTLLTRPTLAALLLAAGAAQAHDGHGMTGSHWHASDSFGLLLFGGAAVLAYWFTRGGK